jgi:hypothetical protein
MENLGFTEERFKRAKKDFDLKQISERLE